MYARRVSMQLKPHTAPELTERLEREIIPMLRKQQGFKDEITLVATGGTSALGISLWDKKEDADNYVRQTYPEVVKILSKFTEGTPQVETFDVANSTFHKIAASATVTA